MASKNPNSKNHSSLHFTRPKKKPASTHSSSRIFENVVGLAETLSRPRKAYWADKLRGFAEATRNYADSISNIPTVGQLVNVAAETTEELADYIVHNNVEQMIDDAGTFARRRPATILWVTMAAGLATSHLIMPLNQASKSVERRRTAAQKTTNAKRQGIKRSGHLQAS